MSTTPTSGAAQSAREAEEVQSIMDRQVKADKPPRDPSIVPVLNFLLPGSTTTTAAASSANGSSSSSSALATATDDIHWFCPKVKSGLHRNAATFLIFLFAYKGETSDRWFDTLGNIVGRCASCARGFGAARRNFGRQYLSTYPLNVRNNFFRAIDKWQAGVIVQAWERDQPLTGVQRGILELPLPYLQLLFNEPTLLEPALLEGKLVTALDEAITAHATGPTAVASLGLTPVLVALLASPDIDRRDWARVQVGFITRPVAIDEWTENGTGSEAQTLLLPSFPGSAVDQWLATKTLVSLDCLTLEVIQRGLLEGYYDVALAARPDKSIMTYISRLLGTSSDSFRDVFATFTTLLHLSPTHHIWAFDTSPELPHTMFSEIKKNTSFQAMTAAARPSSLEDPKGKAREGSDMPANTLLWMSDFLLSACDTDETNASYGRGCAEALAQAINFCFAEMQHDRLPVAARVTAAEAGCEALTVLQAKLGSSTEPSAIALASTIEVHAPFICNTGFQQMSSAWDTARAAARSLICLVFRADGRAILESLLGLAVIGYTERRRLKAKKRGKVRVLDPVPVENLHRVRVHRELWSMAYLSLSAKDAAGLALLMVAVGPFAHVETLNRHDAWNGADLKGVVKEEDWIASIRAINSSVKATREGFAQMVESLAAQPNPNITKDLFHHEGVARAAVTLLLSPADNLHEPLINLVQQSFEDVDDRGDCFRVLLQRFPHQAMMGLNDFLSSFILTAKTVPEACSLAKWLVRCFTDVLEALCHPAGVSPPLLQSESFLSTYETSDKKWMKTRVGLLWQLMTDSLALIFKRTSEWAPYYENEVMVDWMRDALIFGRMITENIRVFESASLSRTSAPRSSITESPVKMTSVGKSLVQKLEVVLADLVTWLRLTDVETLHQAYELLKTILGRIAKLQPDLSQDPELTKTLLEIDKFSRPGSTHKCRLSPDLLSELADMLSAFDLPIDEAQEAQEVRSSKASSPEVVVLSDDEQPVSSSSKPKAILPSLPKPTPSSRVTVDKTKEARPKNAFSMMMKKAGGKYDTTTASAPKPTKPRPRQMTLEELENDDLLDNLSSTDLDILERRATAASQFKGKAPAKPTAQAKDKLYINLLPPVVPKKPASSGSFTSKLMRELAADHRSMRAKRGVDPMPTVVKPANVGSGLGAYTGPRTEPKKIQPPPPSSSDSESSSEDEENKGIGALVPKAKELVKPARFSIPERRPIKVLGTSMADVFRQREERRRAAHVMKMRLHPDLTPLYRYVLAWDPDCKDDRPPYPPKDALELANLKPMTTVFANVEQYSRTIMPLFMQELWAQFAKDQTGMSDQLLVEVTTRSYEDDFLDIDVVIPGNLPNKFFLNESDIVTIRLNTPGSKNIFAKVQVFRRKFKESAIKLRILGNMDQQAMGSKAKLQLRKHTSLSTAVREFGALRGLPYYENNILADMLAARSAPMPALDARQIQDAMANYNVNEPQAKAILGSMVAKGFALIQGPPGTGKTKTISGLVGKFLADRKGYIQSAVNGEVPPKAKILVCAPSNAAIDEVCKRLMEGVPNGAGGRVVPNIVRIGVESSVNVAVKDISLDNIVEARVNSDMAKKGDRGTELTRIQQELEEVKLQLKTKQDELAKVKDASNHITLENEIRALNTRRTKLGAASSKAKDAARDATRHLDGLRRTTRDTVLKEADIICATLSGSGQDALKPFTFETVIVDEAAQAIEMSCLIPLKYGAKRCIMVGDPNQLPPTTFSPEAEQNKFNQSLFVRIAERTGSHMHLLSIQYRMHPDISELPSKLFYNNRLKDGPGMAEKTVAVWHKNPIFGPYHFVNVTGVETKTGTSTKNTEEALVAVDLYRNLESQFGRKVNLAMRIGIITMYREQLFELKRKFCDMFGPEITETIDFNTVDGFQGQEKDIIILSCVRSGANLRSIGFLRDFRRMNVALTRAKSSLFVIGNAATLKRSDKTWETIVDDAKDRGFLVDYSPATFTTSAQPVKGSRKRSPSPDWLRSSQIQVGSQAVIPTVGSLQPHEASDKDMDLDLPSSEENGPPLAKRVKVAATAPAPSSDASRPAPAPPSRYENGHPPSETTSSSRPAPPPPSDGGGRPSGQTASIPPTRNGSDMPTRPPPPSNGLPPRPRGPSTTRPSGPPPPAPIRVPGLPPGAPGLGPGPSGPSRQPPAPPMRAPGMPPGARGLGTGPSSGGPRPPPPAPIGPPGVPPGVPGLGPAPSGPPRPPPPRAPPPRAAEDVLFNSRRKKPKPGAGSRPPPPGNVRDAINPAYGRR